MYKIAFSGIERTGKTTFIRNVATALVERYNLESYIIDEITMHPDNLGRNLSDEQVQEELMLRQIELEDKVFASNIKPICLIDRTPLDTFIYYKELNATDRKKRVWKTVARKRLVNYTAVVFFKNDLFPVKPNNHFTVADLVKREDRRKRFWEEFNPCYVYNSITVTNKLLYQDNVTNVVCKIMEATFAKP